MPAFGEWAPDSYLVNTTGVAEASGVLPKANSYGPWPAPASITAAAATVIRGAYTARTTGNAIAVFALSATKGYKLSSGSWTDVTPAGPTNFTGPTTDEYWQVRQYGDNLIGVNGTGQNNPQFIAVTAGTAWADLAGSPPKAKFIEVIGDFVFLGNTSVNGQAIKNSGRNDSAFWTAGSKDSDGQIFPDGGAVQGFSGYEQGGLVFQTETIRRLSLRTDAAVYETHRIDGSRGTSSPYSVVKDGSDVYYYCPSGFMKIGGDGSMSNIGIDHVNEWFLENSNVARPKAIIGALDPIVRRIFWLFPTASNASSTTLDHLIAYDIDRNRWTHTTTALTYIFPSATSGLTLAALAAIYTTLTAVPFPFGSDVWKGGAPGLAAFDSSNKMCFFTGLPMMASVQTSGFEPVPGSRAYVRGFRLIGDSLLATGKIGGAERTQDAILFNGPQAINAQGRIPTRISTRYAQIQVDVPANDDWSDLQGVEFDEDDITPDGKR